MTITYGRRFGCPRAANEAERMATVRAMGHMDLGSCGEMDRLLRVIVDIWHAPSACATLLDSDHVWICNGQVWCGVCRRPRVQHARHQSALAQWGSIRASHTAARWHALQGCRMGLQAAPMCMHARTHTRGC